MGRFLAFLRSHPLLLGFAVAVVPLVLMLSMQYVWLSRLERATAIAHDAVLRNHLEAVGTEVEYFYRSTAERLLNVPASLFTDGDIASIGEHWKNKPHEGARRLLVVDYTRVPTGNFYIYDSVQHALTSTSASDESLAIVLAALPWQMRAYGDNSPQLAGLQVNERNPGHRIILSPINNDGGETVGIAGMIVDREYFQTELLPGAFATADVSDDMVVSVIDERQDVVFGRPADNAIAPAATLRFPFVFNDWTMQLTSTGSTPEQWASTTFVFNMTLGFLLAVALLGGIGVALWAANKAVRLSVMKSDFVSNVSHELRTPLASIRVFAELLRHGKTTRPEKVQEYGEYIEAESRRLSRLIDNILDFSRIEAQQKEYRFEETDLAELVRSVTDSLQLRLERAGFRLRVELPEDPGHSLSVDPDAIGQALHNLIDNAAKYSEPPAEIAVSLRWENRCVVMAVRDQGIGIAKEDHARIFDRFHRVSTGLVHNVKGSGLGLAIVAHVAQAHGGAVEIDSEPGKGSSFSLRLPIRSDKDCSGTVPTAETL